MKRAQTLAAPRVMERKPLVDPDERVNQALRAVGRDEGPVIMQKEIVSNPTSPF